MTGRDLYDRWRRNAEDQARPDEETRPSSWEQLALSQQIAWEDLASWLERQR